MLLNWIVLLPIICLWTAGIIFMLSFNNNNNELSKNYSLFKSVCENIYFKQCTQSRRAWLNCIENVNSRNRPNGLNQSDFITTWPPSSITSLIDDELPIINLALRAAFTKDAENPLNNKHYQHFRSLTESMKDGRGLWSWQYNLFPQMLDFNKLIVDVENGIPLTNLPINNLEIFALRLPKYVCNPCRRQIIPDLIVVIKSCSYCTAERDHARNTFMQKHLWTNFTVQFVFVVGVPYPNESNMFTFSKHKFKLKNSWWALSRKHDRDRWTFMKRLAMEAELHEDLLIGSFHDTYFNLTTKLIFTFRWLSALCPATVPLFIFVDNDYDLVPRNVIMYYKNKSADELRDLAAGHRNEYRFVIRPYYDGNISNIWAVTLKEFPWALYPAYLCGATFMLGSNIVKRLAIASAFTQHIRVDDAYLGILFSKLNILPQNLDVISLGNGVCNVQSGAINIPLSESKRIIDWKTDSNCNTWPPLSVECLIDKRLPAFNLALKFPLARNALDSIDEVTYNKFGDIISANCKKQEILDDEELEEMGSNSTDYSIYPQNLNFSKLIYDIQYRIPVQT
ncbi:hypothetical protein MN116_001882, partial [Schistosoma mekongi]